MGKVLLLLSLTIASTTAVPIMAGGGYYPVGAVRLGGAGVGLGYGGAGLGLAGGKYAAGGAGVGLGYGGAGLGLAGGKYAAGGAGVGLGYGGAGLGLAGGKYVAGGAGLVEGPLVAGKYMAGGYGAGLVEAPLVAGGAGLVAAPLAAGKYYGGNVGLIEGPLVAEGAGLIAPYAAGKYYGGAGLVGGGAGLVGAPLAAGKYYGGAGLIEAPLAAGKYYGGAGLAGAGAGLIGAGAGLVGAGAGLVGAPLMHGYGGELVDRNVYGGGKKILNDAVYEKASGNKGAEMNAGNVGYAKGVAAIKNNKGEIAYANNVASGKKIGEDAKNYYGGQHFDKEGKHGGEESQKAGYKKGHAIKTFKSSHHKDENGKTEEFFDEDHDEGGKFNFGDEFGGFGAKEASSFKGGHENGEFAEGGHNRQSHFNNDHFFDNSNADEGKYGAKKFAGQGSVYGVNNGVDVASLAGHEENSKIYKHIPHHGFY